MSRKPTGARTAVTVSIGVERAGDAEGTTDADAAHPIDDTDVDGAAEPDDQSSDPDDGPLITRHPSELRARLADALRRYQITVDLFDDAVALRLGLNRTDFRCIDILDQEAPMTAGALARAARLSTGAITFVVDRLVEAGYVRRSRDPDDRRRVLIELVPSAQRRAQALHRPMVNDARATLSVFSDDEIEVVTRFLRLSAKVFERNIPDAPGPKATGPYRGKAEWVASAHGRRRHRT